MTSMTLKPAVALCLLLAACAKPAPEEAAPARAALRALLATCAAVSGTVEVQRGGEGAWVPVAVGAVFNAGDGVRAGALSSARLELVSGGRIELSAGATVRLSASGASSDGGRARARIVVQEGVVRGALTAGAVDVETGAGQGAALRNASDAELLFALVATPGGTRVAVTEGKGALSLDAAAAEVALSDGEVASVGADGRAQVQPLVDFPVSTAPGVDARFACRPGQEIALAWQPQPAAHGYLLQVARDLSFQRLHDEASVASAGASLRVRDNGLYVWRVASRDENGTPGEFGFARRIYCEAERPAELLLSPAPNATVTYSGAVGKVVFSWQSAGAVERYRLVVARSGDLLATPVTELKTREQRIEVAGLAEGTYLWGVYTDEPEPRPLFLAPRRLTVHRTSKAKLQAPKSFSDWGK